MEILKIYKVGSLKFTTQNDRYEFYQSKRVVIYIETKFINYKYFHKQSLLEPPGTTVGFSAEVSWSMPVHY